MRWRFYGTGKAGGNKPRQNSGFDHGVGHPLLLLYDAKAPNCRKNKGFKGLGHYA